MTEFEDRLTAALRSAGDDAPDAAGLAPAARRRAGARRRRTALTTVAAVVAVAGVVGGVAVLGSGNGPSRVASDTTSSATATPIGEPVRYETWRDVQVIVPTDWGYGSLSTWCTQGSEPGTPVVDRPGGAVEDIACTPGLGYGVQFLDASDFDFAKQAGEVWQYTGGNVALYPTGAWLGYQRSGANVVRVVAPSRAEAESVISSFHRVQEADVNGCTPHPVDPGPVTTGLLLCRYDVEGWLEQSELLIGDDAKKAVAALEDAPAKGDQVCTMALTGPYVMVYSADAQGRVTLDACHGFFWNGAEHDLTADVLYWVLSPGWSGGVEGEVPMPDRLRE